MVCAFLAGGLRTNGSQLGTGFLAGPAVKASEVQQGRWEPRKDREDQDHRAGW